MASTTNIKFDTTPQVLQTYVLLQIAAEAFLGKDREAAATVPGSGATQIDLDAGMLKDGNLHSTKMTQKQAEKFAADWDVISHQPNTATGFSATLFKLKRGHADASKGTYEGQYVVSFRSTEFIEDAARDNQATNVLELKQGGWAFGQLADMQLWWNSASVQAAVAGQKVDVTGYSLGGSLAASFHILHGNSINKVYTFNGAGVGNVLPGYGALAGLSDALSEFETNPSQSADARLITSPAAQASNEREFHYAA